MPRQRPLSLPAGFSVAASPPRVCANSGLAYRQTIHSELQAPVSSTIYSNEQRSSRSSFSLLLKDARDSEESRASRHSTEATAETLSPSLTACESESESESAYSCGPGQSLPSMADSSDWELDPQDSISNRGPSPSENGRNWLFQHPPGWCNIHSCYMSGEFFDPKYRAWIQVIGPRRYEACHCHIADPRDLLAFYSEERSIDKSGGDRDRSSHHDRYDDDFKEPFAPRRDSPDGSRRSSLNVDWDKRRDPSYVVDQDWEPSDDWWD